MKTSLQFLLFLVLVLLLSACRVKSPTVAEQQELVKRGAFPSGAPAWMSSGAATRQFPTKDAGIIPESFGVPDEVQAAHPNNDPVRAQMDKRRELLESAAPTPEEAVEGGALARIEGSCPGTEQLVTEALTTGVRDERIGKYERLTTRCPASSDLWLWLGKDYQAAGRTADAKRTYEKVIAIDPGNSAARDALDGM